MEAGRLLTHVSGTPRAVRWYAQRCEARLCIRPHNLGNSLDEIVLF